jgi:enoyl-CoA hydratase/carnithine racemase
MEFVLTGEPASGAEFERLGVVTKVFPKADVLPAATALAEKIAKLSGPVIKTAKQAVLTGMLCYVSDLILSSESRSRRNCLDPLANAFLFTKWKTVPWAPG